MAILFSLIFGIGKAAERRILAIFVLMKKFRTNTSVIIGAAIITFALNIFYLVSLYRSIAESVKRDVVAAIAGMDVDELWHRAIVYSGKSDVPHGTISSSMKTGSATVVTEKVDIQGNKKEVNRRQLIRAEPFTNQLMTEMSVQMHRQMDGLLPIDIADADSILRCRLAERGVSPEFVAVEVVDSLGNIMVNNPKMDNAVSGLDVFRMSYGAERYYGYQVYITPLTRQILHEMSGVIITTFLLIAIFAVGFWYLLHMVARLRSIEEMKDNFTSNMTHELKTPITIAYSANDALLNFDTENNPAKREAYLRIALKQLKKLGELVENILAVSMERRQTMKLHIERFNIVPVIREIIAAQQMRSEKEIRLQLSPESDEIEVEADKMHFSNIMNNLIDNAVKYSGSSVEITIACSPAGISVKDNGIGISSKNLPHIFDKFYRVPQGNIQDVRGYGIGLYYVEQMVRKFGWHISVASRLGKGTTFTVKFNNNVR